MYCLQELDLCPSMFNIGEFCALAKKACLESLEVCYRIKEDSIPCTLKFAMLILFFSVVVIFDKIRAHAFSFDDVIEPLKHTYMP